MCLAVGVSSSITTDLTYYTCTTPGTVQVINQIELSPFLQWRELVAYCKDKNIAVQVGCGCI
jgi:diketogulonate reductase-like aldo/keto reductase